jgi:stearoyl-CoA 9-desaturase NADPH oxidoreductase
MLTAAAQIVAGPLEAALSSRWLRPLNDLDALDDLLGRFDATWSLMRIKARVVADVRETPDVRTLVLRPNRLWPGHVAGQHVLVEADVDGRLLRRTFSISSPPRADGTLTITVKRRPGGRLSVWWDDRAAIGDVITLGAPVGEFVLPTKRTERVTMLSAGSGITPVMAMLRDLSARSPETRVLFVHCARSRENAIFLGELEGLAARWPRFELRLHLTGTAGRLDAEALARLAHLSGDDPTFVCGPADFMEAVRQAWRAAGNEERLLGEHFGLPASIEAGEGEAQQAVPQSLRCRRGCAHGANFRRAGRDHSALYLGRAIRRHTGPLDLPRHGAPRRTS